MIIWSDKELEHIKKHLEGTLEIIEKGLLESDIKSSVEILISQIENINNIEIINQLLYDVLDEYYATYWVKGYTSDDLREQNLSWFIEEDCVIYNKMYGI